MLYVGSHQGSRLYSADGCLITRLSGLGASSQTHVNCSIYSRLSSAPELGLRYNFWSIRGLMSTELAAVLTSFDQLSLVRIRQILSFRFERVQDRNFPLHVSSPVTKILIKEHQTDRVEAQAKMGSLPCSSWCTRVLGDW